MTKSFSDHERELVRNSLIEACKECWGRYGYHKTGIREISSIAGISTGAFYSFFASKEILFVETAATYEKGMEEAFHENLKSSPDKNGVAASLKSVVAQMREMPWLSSLWDEWPVILRRLPPDFLQNDFIKDTNRISEIAKQYELKLRLPVEESTRIIDILLMSVMRVDSISGDANEAIGFIIDAVVDKLVE